MRSNSIFSKLSRSGIGLPLIFGFLARLAMFPLVHLDNPKFQEYGWIAQYLAQGKGYSFHWGYGGFDLILPTAYMPPGEVMIEYFGLGLFGDNLAGHTFIFLELAAIGTIFIYATWRIITLLGFSERERRVGAWLAAIYPSFLFASTTFGISTAVITIDALIIWTLLSLTSKFREGKPAITNAIITGALGGALALFRSESYPLLIAVAIFILCQYRRSPKFAKAIAGMAIAFALVVSPWIVRNYVTLHRFIPASTNGGFNFWRGHDEYTTGSSWSPGGHSIWTTDSMWSEIEPVNKVDSNVEFTADAYHYKKAKEWIASNPTLDLERTLRKPILLWGIDWYNEYAFTPQYIAIYFATIIALIAGILRIRNDKFLKNPAMRDFTKITAIWCIYYTIIVMVFFSVPRLQVILVGVYFPIVIYGADWIIEKFIPSRKKV